jgi:hypothetical protein
LAQPYGPGPVLGPLVAPAPPGTAGNHGPRPAGGGASLDLNLLAGPLDPRITFSRASIGTYFDATGVLQTATANTPRFDYDPAAHTALGLLIEEARTNLLLQSGDFNNASWSKSQCTISAAVAAPDGTTTARGMITAAGQLGAIVQSYTTVAGTALTLSVFAKAGNRNATQLLISAAAFSDASARAFTFTLTGNGSTSSGSAGATATIQAVGNGWYRCILTATPDVSITTTVHALRDTANGDGTTIQLYGWGAQLEAGAFATSYIPTTAATVTRAVDVATMPTAAWFNQATGSLAADAIWVVPPSGPNNRLISEIDDGTTNNRVYLTNQAGGAIVSMGQIIGGVVVLPNIGNLTPGAVAKMVAAYSPLLLVGSMNGAAVVSAATSGVMATLTTVRFGGSAIVGSAPLNGYIRRVRYWPRALSSAELQQVTM